MHSGIEIKLTVGDRDFPLQLCRKPNEEFGPALIDHWWMRVTQLYGQRENRDSDGTNRTSILNFYWASAQQNDSTGIRDTQERFLAASIVPEVRVQGSRTIFADAFLAAETQAGRQRRIEELNELLRPARMDALTGIAFEQWVWLILGRPEFPRETQVIYDSLSDELFDEPCELLMADDIAGAVDLMRNNWAKLMQSIGRRSHNKTQKIVLDAISYEARAAFHHCYSHAWKNLIPRLREEHEFNSETTTFLEFWHTACFDTSTNKFLFCGHVFGLHPAMGPFVATPIGRGLLGSWLTSSNDNEAQENLGRLLNGLRLAAYDYFNKREASVGRSSRQISLDLDEIPAAKHRRH